MNKKVIQEFLTEFKTLDRGEFSALFWEAVPVIRGLLRMTFSNTSDAGLKIFIGNLYYIRLCRYGKTFCMVRYQLEGQVMAAVPEYLQKLAGEIYERGRTAVATDA